MNTAVKLCLMMAALLLFVSCSQQENEAVKKAVKIHVSNQSEVLVNGEAVTLAELPVKLKALGDISNIQIHISADPDVEMGRIQDVQKALRQLNAKLNEQ